MEIVQWLTEQRLVSNFLNSNIFRIEDKNYFIIEPSNKIISDDFTILCSREEVRLIENSEVPIDRVAFLFGKNWYWSELDGETKLNPLRHLGKCFDNLKPEEELPFLGIHGKFELLNGSRDYSDWCKKAKFLGYDTLGICETQTLAGTMVFQEECVSAGIKPIIGQTCRVKSNDDYYFVKLFCKDKQGWRNLLKINKAQLVDNPDEKSIQEDEFMKLSSGLVAILLPDFKFNPWRVKKYSSYFGEDLYFQIDLTEWEGEKRDREWLENINAYIETVYKAKSRLIKPIILQDAYYLDKIDSPCKKALNDIGKVTTEYLSKDQHFYSFEECYEKCYSFFKSPETIFYESIENLFEISNKCDFKIGTKNRFLPRYKQNPEEFEIHQGDNLSLFNAKVIFTFEKKVLPKIVHDQELIDLYLDRIDEESAILEKGNVIDYFLILSDICSWCKDQEILVGHGRGSAGGSLVSYLLDIIQIDPIEHDLLFSRFLTEGRLGIKYVDKNKSEEVEVDEYFEITSKEGEVMKFSKDSELLIMRNGSKITVTFDDIQIGDEII
jgi:DNA polymerase-3 subunit alpha